MEAPTFFLRSIQLPPDQVAYNPERQRIEDAAAKLSKPAFQALVGIFAGFAVLAVGARLHIQIRKLEKLSVDDFLVIFATCCLIVATGFIYHMQPRMYMTAVLSANPKNIALFTKSEMQSLPGLLKWNNLFLVFSWTALNAIKMSFLVLFRSLIGVVSRRLVALWWFVATLTVLSWLFNILRNPIDCGWSKGNKCSPVPRHVSELGWTSSSVDIATDMLIILIPILLLWKSKLHLKQKLGILAFLCLNIFQIIICLGRTIGSGFRDRDGHVKFGIVYTFLLIHVEASVAVVMGGVTAFRTVVASQIRDSGRSPRFTESTRSNLYNRILSWFKRPREESKPVTSQQKKEKRRELLAGPATGGTLQSLRTFIRRHGRETGHTIHGSDISEPPYDALHSYHEYIRTVKSQEPITPLDDMCDKGEPKVSSYKLEHFTEDVNQGQPHEDFDAAERSLPTLQSHNLV